MNPQGFLARRQGHAHYAASAPCPQTSRPGRAVQTAAPEAWDLTTSELLHSRRARVAPTEKGGGKYGRPRQPPPTEHPGMASHRHPRDHDTLKPPSLDRPLGYAPARGRLNRRASLLIRAARLIDGRLLEDVLQHVSPVPRLRSSRASLICCGIPPCLMASCDMSVHHGWYCNLPRKISGCMDPCFFLHDVA